MAEVKTRTYKVTFAVTVDDASKPVYEIAMEELCTNMLNEIKSVARQMDHNTGRLKLEIERLP